MLYRKFAHRIEEFLKDEPKKVLLINGARQIANSLVASGYCKVYYS